MKLRLLLVLMLGAPACTTPAPALVAIDEPGPPKAKPPPPAPSEAKTTGAIAGVVRDAAGAPYEGALVAAVPEDNPGGPTSSVAEASAPAALARSGPGGRFTLPGLRPAGYAVTVTAPGIAAAFVPPRRVAAGQTVEVAPQLGAGGVTLTAAPRSLTDKALPCDQLRAARVSNSVGDLFYAEPDMTGTCRITVERGKYELYALVPGHDLAMGQVDANADRTVEMVAAPDRKAARPAPAEVVEGLRASAIHLTTPEAGHGWDDMAPLAKVVGDARIVALGEATHGTREFFQLKHRMLEYLVEKLGFTVFAIEASAPEAFDVNEYVLTGRGDARKALASLGFWTWNTEEVLAQIEWMRRYNADPRHTKKVKFYGFDMQSSPLAARRATAYIDETKPAALAAAARKTLAPLGNSLDAFALAGAPAERQGALAAAVAELEKALDGMKPPAGPRAERWAVARHHARILSQYVALLRASSGLGGANVRDQAMADNAAWILEHEGPAAKMVVWAHNGHVARASLAFVRDPMGKHLAARFGRALVVFGFAFNRGAFQAMEWPRPRTGKALHAFTVGAAPEDSLDATLARTGAKVAAWDLRAVADDSPAGVWLGEPRRTRQLGSTYSERFGEDSIFTWLPLRTTFDALLFVEETSAARPVESTSVAAGPQHDAPQNLDFEDIDNGAPAGWTVPPRDDDSGYHATLDERQHHAGARALKLARPPARRGEKYYGDATGTVSQRADARPYRGKRVRLRAWVRAEVAAPSSQGRMYLQIGRGAMALKPYTFQDMMADRPIVEPVWREVEITGEVPGDADLIQLGFALIGDGALWADAVSLEAVEAAPAK